MKFLMSIVLIACFATQLLAQVIEVKKPSTLAFHVFYNDFETVRQIRTGSLKQVLDNGQWRKVGDMQMGFGVNYLKGLGKRIDAVATLDASSIDYPFRNGTTNGKSKFLIDASFLINMKLLTDRHTLVPYFSAGPGLSFYHGKAGYYGAAGTGIQVNLFGEAFVLASSQARFALSPEVNHHFQHSIGIGTRIGKRKKADPPVNDIVATAAVPVAKISESPTKNIQVKVTDQQTGLPLARAEIVLSGPAGKINGFSDAGGRVNFNAVQADDYTLTGILHGIKTDSQTISKNAFDASVNEILIDLRHNDPRFTLAVKVSNKNSGDPEHGAALSQVNNTNNTTVVWQHQQTDSMFNVPLAPNSDFSISAKKAGYISSIEKVSTKGLNRSTTLYVGLQLQVEETLTGKTIGLKNIYYDSGSATIRPEAYPGIEQLITFLKDNPGFSVEIASHSDSRGDDASNLSLSQARAEALVSYLQKNEIDKARLSSKGYGETQLINTCRNGVKCTDAEHALNRRTEFKVIGKLQR